MKLKTLNMYKNIKNDKTTKFQKLWLQLKWKQKIIIKNKNINKNKNKNINTKITLNGWQMLDHMIHIYDIHTTSSY